MLLAPDQGLLNWTIQLNIKYSIIGEFLLTAKGEVHEQ